MNGQQTSTTITAWSAVSSLGIGRQAFRDGITGRCGPARPLDRTQWPAPVERARLVPDFSIRDVLGSKGTRSMDRATGLAVVAVGRLLREVGWIPGTGPVGTMAGDGQRATRGDTALVLGTNTGSAQSIMDFTRDSITQPKPYFVDPARFPNTVMNCATGTSAIWYGLRGPNTTISAGRVSGLQALSYALRLQAAGRADAVLCGAVEEFSAARAWLEWHAGGQDERPGVLGEGCAILMLDAPGSTTGSPAPLATVLGLDFGVFTEESDAADLLVRLVDRLLLRTGVRRNEVVIVAPSQAPGPLGAREEAAVDKLLGGLPAERVRTADVIGDTSAASAAFQITALLSMVDTCPAARSRVGLVTAVDRDGAAGCALLRLH